MDANSNQRAAGAEQRRHYLVHLYFYIASLFGREPVLPGGPFFGDELEELNDSDVLVGDRPSQWNAESFYLVPDGRGLLLLDDNSEFIYSWSAERLTFQCRTAETWLQAASAEPVECKVQPGGIHHHATVPRGWLDLYFMDARLRYLAAKRRLDEGTYAINIVLSYLSTVYSTAQLPVGRRAAVVQKILAWLRPRLRASTLSGSMTRGHKVLSNGWTSLDRAPLSGLGMGIQKYLKIDFWERYGEELLPLRKYVAADYDDGRDVSGATPILPVEPFGTDNAEELPHVAGRRMFDSDDEGEDRAAVQEVVVAADVHAPPRRVASEDDDDDNAASTDGDDDDSEDGRPLARFVVPRGRVAPQPLMPDAIVIDEDADVDTSTNVNANASNINAGAAAVVGPELEPQVELHILPNATIDYHLSLRSGVVADLPVDDPRYGTHRQLSVVRTPNGPFNPQNLVLVWVSAEEVAGLEIERARKRARLE